MGLTKRDALGLAAGFAAAGALPARAQFDWPNRALRILVGTSPGGSPDIVSRLFADKFASRLGQSITVENNTGGGGGIAAGMVSNAPPDGTNLTM
ncbi:MAG TPA: tripartite tricarboxylate transporter substrate-binding protein, partial [Burkholderiaceae bacterium]|nr:tripartite tricarboxylate transporter substrate-binding protein [Burkholderiaceae bacterium]